MDQILKILEQISLIPKSNVDQNYGQGQAAVAAQLSLRAGMERDLGFVKNFITSCKRDISEIKEWTKPYQLPDDYLFFLEYSGGLEITGRNYYLTLNGVGPMVEDWYSYLMGDDSYSEPSRDGLLSIGSLHSTIKLNERYFLVLFFLDLAGLVQQNSIIGIGPWKESQPKTSVIIRNLSNYSNLWCINAVSFASWLELIAETQGRMNYPELSFQEMS